jgi:hypothetical protein
MINSHRGSRPVSKIALATGLKFVGCRLIKSHDSSATEVCLVQTKVLQGRVVDPHFEPPRDNRYLQKIVKFLYPDTHAHHHIGWTFPPRSFAKLFKTRIAYESYPEGQDEVVEMVTRKSLDMSVITIRRWGTRSTSK